FFTDFLDGLQIFFGKGIWLLFLRALEEKSQVLDDHQALAEAVVEFGGDALSFVFLRGDELAGECLLLGMLAFELQHAEAPSHKNDSPESQQHAEFEQERSIEWRSHGNRNALSFGVPDTVGIRGDYLERVTTRRDVRIVRR